MSSASFVHLRLHSEYSVSDGIVRLETDSGCPPVDAARADGMPALALTDLSNVFGLLKFYKAARKAGVKPIAGCDVWIENEDDRDKPFRLLLLCQSRTGYRNLSVLLTRAYRENPYRGRAEFKQAWFAGEGGAGLIALSGAHLGDVGAALLAGNTKQARARAQAWEKIFGDRFYLEVQRLPELPDGAPWSASAIESCVQQTAQLATTLQLPLVATHPIQFMSPDEFRAHETRVCIADGYTLADARRPKRYSPEQYFKTQAEMAARYADMPQALANTIEIAKRCNLTLELGKPRLPQFPTPAGMGLDAFLVQQAEAGLKRRLEYLYPDAAQREQETPRYRERLAFETKTIIQMGFPGYFLIVADFINWAKNNNVPVGPGRGSGAGSLVAYALGITDLDPLRYELLFERFLNPERVSMPDFDIDFCQDGRDRVIEYVRNKYGGDSVSQIATFGTMAAKGVVRDVGRVLDLGYNFCDQISKLIPFQPGKLITLAMAREMEPQLKAREDSEEEVHELLALGEQLEGMTRNVGMHAGGVLIAPGKLTDFCPLYAAEGSGTVSQFDMKDVEAAGLVKFDFLGLTTLTILDWTLRFIRRLHPDATLKLEDIPLDDAETYKLFMRGDTTAIFQFESDGMRQLLKQARPDRLEDLIALNALYRPGPMDLIPDFVDRKHGRKPIEYPDPRVESVLKETYGIMVYQEQVMQMAQIVGGYTLGGADLLRRAMGKKIPEEMAKHREIFREGAAKNGVNANKADAIFDLMEKFAGYGFNKSHAAAYSLVAYQTAYLKVHHTAAFMAANLSAVMNDTDKVKQFHEDTRANGITIRPPDINRGEYRFVPVDEKTIDYGLGAIKGTGEAAINIIVAERERKGAYTDLFDFCQRVDKRLVNRRVIEALIRAGAFDGLDDHRARLLASVGIAITAAEQSERNAQQNSLFGGEEEAQSMKPALIEAPHWDKKTFLREEKTALGFYLSGHPFSAYQDEIKQFVRVSLNQLTPANDYGRGGENMRIAGVVEDVIRLQKWGRVLIALSDGTATREVSLENEAFEPYRKIVVTDAVVVVEAKVRSMPMKDSNEMRLRIDVDKIYDLDAARAKFARRVQLEMNGQADAARLKNLLSPYRVNGDDNAGCPVTVIYHNASGRCELQLGEAWRVTPRDDLLQSLKDWLTPENVSVIYP